jgi:hypothetical protein
VEKKTLRMVIIRVEKKPAGKLVPGGRLLVLFTAGPCAASLEFYFELLVVEDPFTVYSCGSM